VNQVDPVRARRVRIANAARIGQRLGYGLFAAALLLLVAGLLTTFTPLLAALTTICLVAGCVVLAPAIVAGYAAKAAEREDRERGL
jgi:hypothetical protein